MSTSRRVHLLVVAAGICLLAGARPNGRGHGQQPPADPTFRADASFVLTDVFVTADGTPVTDLTQADFEVREDGVVQTIRSFEAIRHDANPVVGLPRRNPSTVAESSAMASDPRRRVFVVFLDTYHVDRAGSMRVRTTLESFFRTSFEADDLIAYLTPHMSGADISFSTTTEPLLAYLKDNPIWGVADEAPGAETDAIERDLQRCFCCSKDMDRTWLALRSRLREQKSLEALRGLVAHLDGIRESRKAVIAATMGWRLFRDNEARMTDAGTDGRIVGVQPIGIGPDGRLGTPDRTRAGGSTMQACDIARLEATYADSQILFQDLIGEANRSSTSFYTLDVAGLRTEGRPITTTPTEAIAEMRNRERMPYSTPLDSIRRLGETTNGMAIVNTNDLDGGLRRAVADLNSYYLLGYTSSNPKPDGKYRKIKVTVKRPGVKVRAREGYLARRIDDRPPATSSTRASGAASADQVLFAAALGRLEPARPGVPLVVSASAGAVAGGTTRAIRVTAELDPAIAATPEWAEGGEAQAVVRDAKGDTVTTARAALAKGARTIEIELPIAAGLAGDVKVQVRVSGAGALARYTDTTTVALDAVPAGWGAPRLSRRGPSTGVAWVPTADPRFRRQERLRVTVTVGPEAGTVTGTLLDRQGKPINVPVKIDQSDAAALVAELALAPLAVGDYVLALGGGSRRVLVPLRVVQ